MSGWQNLKRLLVVHCAFGGDMHLSIRTNLFSTTPSIDPSIPPRSTGAGVKRTYPCGSGMPVFEYRQAEEVRNAFRRYGVRYLFIGKSGAILLGFPDTTQDADIFVEKNPENGEALVEALKELGFKLTKLQVDEIIRGKDFIQLKNGPFDLDLVFARYGIERFEDAYRRRIEVEKFPVCHIDDIIAGKEAAGRDRDRESLPRLKAFREYWIEQNR